MGNPNLPTRGLRLVEPSGAATNEFYTFLRGLSSPTAVAEGSALAAALAARISLLEALRLHGSGGITVTGSLENGFRIHLTASPSDVLASQIFGS